MEDVDVASIKSNYPKLELIFKRSLIKFSYLPGVDYQKKKIYRWFYLLAWPCIFSSVIRNSSLAAVKKIPKFSLSLRDPTFFIGDEGFWLLIVCILWSQIATIVRYFFYKSNYSSKLKNWIHHLVILENPDDKTFQTLTKLINHASKWIPIFTSIGSWMTYVPVLLGFPIEYLFMTIIYSIITGCYAYLVSAWVYNFVFLLGFYLYYCAHRFQKLNNSFQKDCNPTKYGDNLIQLCREIINSEYFWYPVYNTIFIGTFFGEILLLYLSFFAEISIIDRVFVVIFGIFTTLYGQSTSFISGTILQYKFDNSVKQLQKYLQSSKSISPILKLQSLIVLDYLIGRNIFTVYWSINVCTRNYLKVQIEAISLLLLLLANINRVKLSQI